MRDIYKLFYIAIVLSIFACCGFCQPPSWPSLGGNMQRTGLSPDQGPVIGCVKWRFQTADEPTWPNLDSYEGAGVYSSVTIGADGRVHFSSEDGFIYAIDQDGNLLWKYQCITAARNEWAWSMDDGEGEVLSASAGGLDGSMHNFVDSGGGWGDDAKFGRALEFDGVNDYVQIDGFTGIGGSVPRRISAWIKTTATAAPVLCWGNSDSTDGRWWIYLSGGLLQVRSQGAATGTVAVNTGQWVHIEVLLPAGKYHVDGIQMFVDDQRIETTTLSPESWIDTDTNSDVYIGHNPFNDNYFAGSIADVHIEELEPTSNTISGTTIAPDGSVYAGYGSSLHAVNPDGTGRWIYDTDAFISGTPAVDDNGNVYFGSADGNLYAVDAYGAKLWHFPLPGLVLGGSVLQTPSIGTDGTIYIGGAYNSILYALNPADGGIVWESDLSGGEDTDKTFIVAPVVADDGTIYVTAVDDTKLYALDPADGTVKWSTQLAHDPGLIGYWKFNDLGLPPISENPINPPIKDSSMYDQSLSTPTPYTFLRFIQGVMNTTLYGVVRDSDFKWPDDTRSRTITFWLRVNDTSQSFPLIEWMPNSGGGESLSIWPNRVVINNGHLICQPIENDKQWHHIAVALEDDGINTDLDDVKIYIDGIVNADSENNGGLKSMGYPLPENLGETIYTITVRSNLYSIIDDLRIYNKVLDENTIKELMHDETAPLWKNPDMTEEGPLGAQYCWTEPAIGPDGTIYIGFDDNYIRAIDPENGQIKWIKRLGNSPGYYVTVDKQGKIYATGEDDLYVIDSNGRFLSVFEPLRLTQITSGPLYPVRYIWASSLSTPAIGSDGTIYLADAYNRVWALSGSDCEDKEAVLASEQFKRANLNKDGHISLADLAVLAEKWRYCNDWELPCHGMGRDMTLKPVFFNNTDNIPELFLHHDADLNQDNYVDVEDLALLAMMWLFE